MASSAQRAKMEEIQIEIDRTKVATLAAVLFCPSD